MIKQIIYVMSSTYSGSTILSAILGSSPNAYFVGEPALIFRRNASGRWRHQIFCTACKLDPADTECPIWGRPVIHAVRARPELYFDILNRRVPEGSTRLVDSSKNLRWIDSGLCHTVETCVLHITKPVEAFLASLVNREKARFNLGYCAQHWSDENLRIVDYCRARRIKYLHVDYNQFARNPDETLFDVENWSGSGPISRQAEWTDPPHYIKGNPGTATHFTSVEHTEELEGMNSELYRAGHRRIFLDEKWRTLINAGQVKALYNLRCVRAASDVFGYRCPDLNRSSELASASSLPLAVGATAYRLSRPHSRWKRRREFERLPNRATLSE